MNYIGLDTSKISTALVLETNNTEYIFSYNTNEINNKWNKLCSSVSKINCYKYDNTINSYSDSEFDKLKQFSKISTDLINDIMSVIDLSVETLIYIEGFSYGKDSSQIIDLVGIGSVIRNKLYENIPNISSFKIISPKSLKSSCAEIVYGSNLIDIGKKKPKIVKIINSNKNNVPGGEFTKTDICSAIIEFDSDSNWKQFIFDNKDDILKNKTIPKPIEDINDAFILKELAKFNNKNLIC